MEVSGNLNMLNELTLEWINVKLDKRKGSIEVIKMIKVMIEEIQAIIKVIIEVIKVIIEEMMQVIKMIEVMIEVIIKVIIEVIIEVHYMSFAGHSEGVKTLKLLCCR